MALLITDECINRRVRARVPERRDCAGSREIHVECVGYFDTPQYRGSPGRSSRSIRVRERKISCA
jgi:hypothetical protein